MWTYNSANGNLSHNGGLVGTGYSGHEAGLNNPILSNIHNVGPIPQGYWTIGEFFDDPGGKGPIVAHVTPQEGTDVFGRAGFMIHGDNSEADHSASHGCIILARPLREQIRDSADTELFVA